MRINKKLFASALLIVLFTTLLVQLPIAIAARAADYEWFDPIIDIRRILIDDFVEPPNLEAMQTEIIHGMVESLGDPHTVYVPPADEMDFTKELRGNYVGIGAEINIVDGWLTIMSPMDGSPALEAGIRAGDVVQTIDGTSTENLSVDKCIDLLMGEPGTPVITGVLHADGTTEDLSIMRRHIVTRTVTGLIRRDRAWSYCVDADAGIAYILVRQFTDTTTRELRDIVAALEKDNVGGIILDLRDNPGGALPAAIDVSDIFLTEGNIVTVKTRDPREERTWAATDAATLTDAPLVVLVNENSASASEIVAGALSENDRAVIVGERSYGKGSVQEVRPLDYDRGILKFTTAHYHLPSGRNINKSRDSVEWGVDPSPGMVVAESNETHVARYEKRRPFTIITDDEPAAPDCVDATWIRDELGDVQLAAAVEALVVRLADNEWPVITGDNAAVVSATEALDEAAAYRVSLIAQLREVDAELDRLHDRVDTAGGHSVLPDDVDLTDAVLTVHDRDGAVVGSWRIENGSLELALDSMDLEPTSSE